MAKQWSPDEAKDHVNQIFTYILERQPDDGGLATYTAMLESGQHSVREIVSYVGNSSEFEERFIKPNSVEQAVGIAYQKFLGRTADEGGLRANTGIAEREGVKRVVELFITSPEYQNSWGEDTPPSKVD